MHRELRFYEPLILHNPEGFRLPANKIGEPWRLEINFVEPNSRLFMIAKEGPVVIGF
jgi:hypothetical protein